MSYNEATYLGRLARAAAVSLLVSASSAGWAQVASYTPQQAEEGLKLYQVNCAGCHLSDLGGSNEARPLTTRTRSEHGSVRASSACPSTLSTAL